jgi:hypothetical protein
MADKQCIFVNHCFSTLHMLKPSADAEDALLCAGCNNSFTRLSSHINQSAVCRNYYCSTGVEIPLDAGIRRSQRSRSTARAPSADAGLHLTQSKTMSQGCREPFLEQASVVEGGFPVIKNAAVVVEEDIFVGYDDDACVFVESEDGTSDESVTSPIDTGDRGQPDGSVLELYEELSRLQANPLGLDMYSRKEKVSIGLLDILKDMNAPLNAFSRILNWAAKSNESGYIFKTKCQPTRQKVMSNLYERYNMDGLIPIEKKLYLPYSKRIVSMVYFDAREVFASLLSCPILNQDESFLFHEQEDPFAEPPISDHVGDINTGRCYHETYKALVKKKGLDMLLPSVLAMDKTHLDLAGRLQMEPITISHGLLKHSIRSQPIAMRILGYINHTTPAHKRSPSAKEADFNAPDHLPHGTEYFDDALKPLNGMSWSAYLLNEVHIQIRYILEESGFLHLQDQGFVWKLNYGGKVFDVVLHPYVPFIVGDTEGHDRLCGHYTARFKAVKQLCRACQCPTELSGYSKAKYLHRKPRNIKRLVDRVDLDRLKLQSQNYLKNGFDNVRFGMHNDRGIFGACPGEMLHLISLGWFKYCLDAFTYQAGGRKGNKSVALQHYDGLCGTIGKLMARQSDRDLPRTNFPKGFSSGANLMGHEVPGCLLVKLFALHTTKFQDIFMKQRIRKVKKPKEVAANKVVVADDVDPPAPPEPVVNYLCQDKHVVDWKLMVSSLLQWLQWMKQGKIPKSQVRKSHYAVKWLMRNMKRISPRATGMGNNTIKMHLVLHICEDILDHGVPENVNSAYAESAHITLAKRTSSNTQKRASTFTRQAAERYIENLAISRAACDVEQHRHSSHIAAGVPGEEDTHRNEAVASGRKYSITSGTRGGFMVGTFRWQRTRKSDNREKDQLMNPVTNFLIRYICPHVPDGQVQCFTELISDSGDMFRAHPNYDGIPWYDKAMVDWIIVEKPGKKLKQVRLPAIIRAFIDLSRVSAGVSIHIAVGDSHVRGGKLYAVMNSFQVVDADVECPNAMIGRYKVDRHGPLLRPTLYVVEASAIATPTLGIRDIGDKVVGDEFLFLFRRRVEWPGAWDSMIQKCSTDPQSAESAYGEVDEPTPEDKNLVEVPMVNTAQVVKKPPKKKRRH